jgi:adenosyl cobinamide kinase/adenosyl cobinamide phosphate guanylyltransferase
MLLTGGARSGKSALAVRIARAQPAPVVLIATAQPDDPEMASRIAAHRRQRPKSWETVEEPLDLPAAIARVPSEHCLIVDCLTLWTANVLEARGPSEMETEAAEASARASSRAGLTLAITNEVGMGLVPDNPLGRTYRDLLGRVNSIWGSAATRSYLLVAGQALPLSPVESLVEELT